MDIKLEDNEEKILSYLKSKEDNTGYSDVNSNEISVFLGISRGQTFNILNSLKEKGYLLIKQEGKTRKYFIKQEGRDYLSYNSVETVPAEEVKSLTFKDFKEVRDTLDEIADMKQQIEDLKKNYEDKFLEMEGNINGKISSFYGRIGEILTLIITAVAMIVFNIQLIGTVKINFDEPLKAAQTILAIDLPYIVLFSILLLVFHIIIGKDEKRTIRAIDVKNVLLKSMPIVIIIVACLVFIA